MRSKNKNNQTRKSKSGYKITIHNYAFVLEGQKTT